MVPTVVPAGTPAGVPAATTVPVATAVPAAATVPVATAVPAATTVPAATAATAPIAAAPTSASTAPIAAAPASASTAPARSLPTSPTPATATRAGVRIVGDLRDEGGNGDSDDGNGFHWKLLQPASGRSGTRARLSARGAAKCSPGGSARAAARRAAQIEPSTEPRYCALTLLPIVTKPRIRIDVECVGQRRRDRIPPGPVPADALVEVLPNPAIPPPEPPARRFPSPSCHARIPC